jgi:hypothetical protein
MATILIAFVFTVLIFGFFLYYYAWKNRHTTQIRLAINKIDGRVISIERIVKEKKIQVDHHPDSNSFSLKNVVWKVVYKDRHENLDETYCTLSSGKLDWDPPLK